MKLMVQKQHPWYFMMKKTRYLAKTKKSTLLKIRPNFIKSPKAHHDGLYKVKSIIIIPIDSQKRFHEDAPLLLWSQKGHHEDTPIMYDKSQKDHHEDAPIMQEKSHKNHHEDAPPPTTIPLPPLYKERKRQGRGEQKTTDGKPRTQKQHQHKLKLSSTSNTIHLSIVVVRVSCTLNKRPIFEPVWESNESHLIKKSLYYVRVYQEPGVLLRGIHLRLSTYLI